jgi:hypothetical protein
MASQSTHSLQQMESLREQLKAMSSAHNQLRDQVKNLEKDKSVSKASLILLLSLLLILFPSLSLFVPLSLPSLLPLSPPSLSSLPLNLYLSTLLESMSVVNKKNHPISQY